MMFLRINESIVKVLYLCTISRSVTILSREKLTLQDFEPLDRILVSDKLQRTET